MKALKLSVLVALFVVGTLSTLCVFGDPAEPISDGQWFAWFGVSALIAAASWLSFARLAKKRKVIPGEIIKHN